MQLPVTLYWQPGCTSCLRAKEFLKQNCVKFKSVNIADDVSGFKELAKHGMKSVPVLRHGNRFLYAQVLAEMADFLKIKAQISDPLPMDELAAKLDAVLAAAQGYILQLPTESLNMNLPGRKRTVRELSYHIFRIVECFIHATSGSKLEDKALNDSPRGDLSTTHDLASHGGKIAEDFRYWWANQSNLTGMETISTYFGIQSLHTVMERTTWHSAQHTRQLMMVLEKLGIDPKQPLSPASLSGLPLPTDVWDS